MADPLSIVSGVAGILALAGSVASTCYRYGCAVKDGPEEVQRLVEEVTSLSGILNVVKTFIDFPDDLDHGDDGDDQYEYRNSEDAPPPYVASRTSLEIEYLTEPLDGTRTVLEALNAALKKAELKSDHRMGRVVKKLLWPLKKHETLNLTSKLERFKSSFLVALSTAQVSLESQALGALQDIRNLQNVERLERQMEKQVTATKKILQWLCPINCANAHRAAQQLKVEGTGSWMLKNPIWSTWLQNERSFLWLYGIPGSGKTVLTSTLLEHCYASTNLEKSHVIYFYCDFRQKESQRAEIILGGLISQLCSQFKELPSALGDFVEAHRGPTGQLVPPSAENLQLLLLQLLQDAYRSIIVIDGIDECINRESILELLKGLPGQKNCVAKVLVTSRQERDIEEAFLAYKSQSTRVHAVDQDIDSYISTCIAKSKRLQRLKPELKETVRQSLLNGAHGMFRWVQCQIDTLSQLRTDRDIRQALTKLPRDLKETYNRILHRIDESDAEVAHRALMWLAYASRPICLNELAEAIGVDSQTTSRDPEAQWYPPDLLQVVGSLARYTADDDSIVLAHNSVKEHLESGELADGVERFRLTPGRGNIEIAQTCIRYLMMSNFDKGPCNNRDDMIMRLEEYMLLPYAARFWPLHARPYLSESKELFRLACKLFDPIVIPQFTSWLEGMISQGYYRYHMKVRHKADRKLHYYKRIPKDLTPLYYAASFGLTLIVKYLINQGVDLDQPGGLYGGTALHAAVYRDHADVIELLIKAGACASSKDTNGMTPRHIAKYLIENESVTGLLSTVRRNRAERQSERATDVQPLSMKEWLSRDELKS